MDEEAVTREAGEAPGAAPQTQDPQALQDAEPAAGQRSGWDDPRLPWAGRPRRVDILLWAGIVLSGIYYWAMLPFRAPLVGTHPVVLELLSGSTEAIISASAFARLGHGTLLVILLAAIPGLMKFDWLYWWAGKLWGERLITLLSGKRNRGHKYMRRVQRWGRKFTWPAVVIAPFLPIPTAIIYAVVGWAGMRLVTFLILDAVGTLLWAGMLAGLGYALGHHAVVVAQTISHYGLWISIALIVVIVFFQVRSQRHMIRTAGQATSAATGGQASPAATGGQASPAATGGQASPAATGGQARMAAQVGDEPGS